VVDGPAFVVAVLAGVDGAQQGFRLCLAVFRRHVDGEEGGLVAVGDSAEAGARLVHDLPVAQFAAAAQGDRAGADAAEG